MRNSTDEGIRCPLRLYDGAPDVQNKLRRNVEINSHITYEIENDYFKGHLLFFVEGLSSTPVHLFKDHKRKSHLIVQGGFKRPVGFDDAVTGQRFTRPLKQLPSKWILELVFMLARRLVPSIHIGCPEAPYILSPLISTAQAIHVGTKGDSIHISSEPVEDMRALQIASKDGKTPLSASARKRFFSKARNRRGRSFTTDHTYTFHFWQHMLDCSRFKLDVGFATFDLAEHLDGQPLQLMAQCNSDGGWLWRLLLEHECQGNKSLLT